MARKDFGQRNREDERYGRSREQYWNREDEEGMGDERDIRRREFQEREREYGNERRFGSGYQDMEERERYEGGYGGRGWEASGMGEPRTYGEGSYRRSGRTYGGMYGGSGIGQNYGESGTYGGSSMYGGGYGAGMTGQPDWGRDPYGTARQRGRFYGRGPKGYRRSDDRIREDVNEMLFRHHDVDASDVEVEVREGNVTLSGTVDSREVRRMAEDCVWDVTGVQNVTNQMRVEPNRPGNGGEWERGTRGRTTQQTGSTRVKGKNR